MANKIVYVPAESGRAYWGPGDLYTFLITGEESGGSYFTMEALVPPGGGPPPHIHHREEEQFYILEGAVTLQAGEQTVRASEGDFVHISLCYHGVHPGVQESIRKKVYSSQSLGEGGTGSGISFRTGGKVRR